MARFGKLKGKLLLFIVSFFGAGLVSKRMPGTIGSFVATLILLNVPKSLFLILALFIASFFIGLFCCSAYIPKYETDRDPGYIVIDEACGIFLITAIFFKFGFSSNLDVIIAFILFRIFDILKPFPIKHIEQCCKRNERFVAFGIMIDDIIAAILAASIQLLWIKFAQ